MSDSPGRSGATARPPTLRKILSASSSRPSTLMACGLSKRAWPRMNVHPPMPSSHDSTPCRSASMTLSLRAFTFAMSTVISPVPTPYSAPRRASCAAWALATSVLVGMQPVLTQVPPTSLRSITATVSPASVSLPASGGPAWPAPTMIASNFSAIERGSDDRGEADEEGNQESAADRNDVFADRHRPVTSAVGRGEACARRGAPQRARHRADHACAKADERVVRGAAEHRARKCAHDETGGELRRGPAARRLWQLVGDQFHDQEDRQHGDGDGMGHPVRPLIPDVDPSQKRSPRHHRRRRQRPQTGDDTDREGEQNYDDLRHADLPGGGNDIRTLTRTRWANPANQKRQNLMSEARIAFAPMAAISSMMALTSRRGTSARTATHAGSASGAMVGDSSPGVTAVASSRTL